VLGHASEESTNLYMSVDRQAPARVRTPDSRSRAVMSGHGLDQRVRHRVGRLSGVQGEHGIHWRLPAIWYLKQFDAYCAEHDRTVFDKDTVEGWVGVHLQRLWPLPVLDVLHP